MPMVIKFLERPKHEGRAARATLRHVPHIRPALQAALSKAQENDEASCKLKPLRFDQRRHAAANLFQRRNVDRFRLHKGACASVQAVLAASPTLPKRLNTPTSLCRVSKHFHYELAEWSCWKFCCDSVARPCGSAEHAKPSEVQALPQERIGAHLF